MSAVMTPVTASLAQQSTDIGATLSWFCHGAADPTTWVSTVGRGPSNAGHFVRATLTPDGPGTVSIWWSGGDVVVESFGPGGAWLHQQSGRMIGAGDTDDHGLAAAEHPVVAAAAHADRYLRFGASGDLYHELLPTILGQRITIGEAHRQWKRLCLELGERAPGPFTRLLLPPAPSVLARQPSWWFHALGIERKRAEPLIDVARHASKFWGWSALGASEASTKLGLVPGVGQWTIGSVLGPALGDPDAVAVGDYHLKNVIAHNLAGEARGTDERMLELLKPYAGQRGRVARYVARHGSAAPKFGPKKRGLPMHAW